LYKQAFVNLYFFGPDEGRCIETHWQNKEQYLFSSVYLTISQELLVLSQNT